MARTTEQIEEQMDAAQASETELTTLDSPSQVAIYTLWKFVTAQVINFVEQLFDIFTTNTNATIAASPVPSDSWLQSKVLEFQYSTITPQAVQLINFVPTYPVVDPTLRIITRASVRTLGSKVVGVKVAKSDPPVSLSAPELAALQDYLTNGGNGTTAGVGIGFAGVQIVASSAASDKIYLKANIYYSGQYAATIQADVILAINNYLAAIPFDGNIKVLSLIDAIQAVAGVTDVMIEDLAVRADATAFGSKTYLIQSFTQLQISYPLFAGYGIEETTGGETFTDKLTFVAT